MDQECWRLTQELLARVEPGEDQRSQTMAHPGAAVLSLSRLSKPWPCGVAESHRAALTDNYRELVIELHELWPLTSDPNPPAPRLTQRLVVLEALSGHTPPKGTLTARDVLVIARRRVGG